MTTHNGFLITACLLGALAVALGAFGAHGLKTVLGPQQLVTFETGVRYLFYHVFALIFVAILYQQVPVQLVRAAGWCFIAGMILFCGSLFMLVYVQAKSLGGYKWLGPVTPLGGIAFIAGWILLALAAIQNK
jgi:uncharacterized membrane protein YgdD (TMEM256/DUF423 family)